MATIHKFPSGKPDFRLYEPPIVLAPHPNGSGALVELEISSNTIERLAKAHLRTQLFQAWGHIVGEFPPINNAFKAQLESTGCPIEVLRNARGCFRGLKRPCGANDGGEDVVIYSFSTPFTLAWQPDMACLVRVVPAPEETVMTVHMRPASALQPVNSGVLGVITKWEFVGACPEHPHLPRDYDNRYDEQLWLR